VTDQAATHAPPSITEVEHGIVLVICLYGFRFADAAPPPIQAARR
jgi:hypothetical protein